MESSDHVAILRRLKDGNRLPYITKLLKIKDEHRRIVPLTLNNVQEKYFQPAIDRQLKATGKVRLVILKARRMGCSTVASANIFADTATTPNTTSYIISKDLASATAIFSMYMAFHSNLPDDLKPMIKHGNARELLYGDPSRANFGGGLNSGIYVQQAGNQDVGRADAVHHVHGSEVAFWPAGKDFEVMASIEQTVPNLENTSIIYESTANQRGGAFHKRYWGAKEGVSDYEAIFVPWFAMDAYQMPLDEGEVIDMTAQEFNLQCDHNLTPEQIKWRRWAIVNKCQNDPLIFKREYPATDEEAFMYSRGSKVFNTELCAFIREDARKQKPVAVRDIRQGQITDKGRGRLKIYTQPTYGRKYVVGVDPSEGLEEGCEMAVEVLDAATMQQVAEWGGKAALRTEFPSIITGIAKYYKNALLVVEANNHGHAVLHGVQDLHYNNIYRRKRVDKRGEAPSMWPGWYTDSVNKQLIIDLTDSLIKDGFLLGLVKSDDLASEMIDFAYDEAGRAKPPRGKFADRLMAYMIALYVVYETFGHTSELRKRIAAAADGAVAQPPGRPQGRTLADVRKEAEVIYRNQRRAENTKKTTRSKSPMAFGR